MVVGIDKQRLSRTGKQKTKLSSDPEQGGKGGGNGL